MSDATTSTSRYVDAFAERESTLPGHDLAWLRGVRRAGIDAFSRSGFPTPRHEHWKYTNVSAIEKRSFDLAAPSSRAAAGLDERLPYGDAAPRLVVVDGRVDRDLSDLRALPPGVRIEDFTRVVEHDSGFLEGRLGNIVSPEKTAFTALNAAFMDSGAVVRVDPETVVDAPVHLVFISGSHERERAYSPRIVIAAGAGSRIAVVERFIGLDDTVYLDNVVTEVEIAPGAAVEHYKVQQASAGAYHVAALEAKLATGASFHSWAVSLGARLSRHDIDVTLDHEHARCSLDGLYVANGRQHVDFHTNVEHAAPRCESHEYYKGIAGGRGRGGFNGRVHVHPDAQKTEAHQTNRNLLLSRNAEIDTKPQLEIHADDVKCSHGATIGQLDEQMLFYLRSRGIPESAARGMLTYGFARDVVDRIARSELRESIGATVLEHLPGGDGLHGILR
ncbi:MAG: Fe-S cluster assembly protein SufD [Thiotrichales bacterium]|nr:Fe-S cluster assembly protein SufD [Thiotrichales bacterium]